MVTTSKFGIYLNKKDGKAVRINSPYWIPSGADWVLVTNDVNATLASVREAAKSKKLTAKPDAISWGTIPLKD